MEDNTPNTGCADQIKQGLVPSQSNYIIQPIVIYTMGVDETAIAIGYCIECLGLTISSLAIAALSFWYLWKNEVLLLNSLRTGDAYMRQ